MAVGRVGLSALLMAGVLLGTWSEARANDETDVRAVVAQETAAWSRYDAAGVAALYTVDDIWQNPFGVRLHGRAELQRFLTNLFQRPGYRAAKDTSGAKIMDLSFAAKDVAVVWSDESSAGQVDDATGKAMKPRHSIYLEVLVRQAGTWRISECLIMDVLQHP